MPDQNISSHVSSKILHLGFTSSRISFNSSKNSNISLKNLEIPGIQPNDDIWEY